MAFRRSVFQIPLLSQRPVDRPWIVAPQNRPVPPHEEPPEDSAHSRIFQQIAAISVRSQFFEHA